MSWQQVIGSGKHCSSSQVRSPAFPFDCSARPRNGVGWAEFALVPFQWLAPQMLRSSQESAFCAHQRAQHRQPQVHHNLKQQPSTAVWHQFMSVTPMAHSVFHESLCSHKRCQCKQSAVESPCILHGMQRHVQWVLGNA